MNNRLHKSERFGFKPRWEAQQGRQKRTKKVDLGFRVLLSLGTLCVGATMALMIDRSMDRDALLILIGVPLVFVLFLGRRGLVNSFFSPVVIGLGVLYVMLIPGIAARVYMGETVSPMLLKCTFAGILGAMLGLGVSLLGCEVPKETDRCPRFGLSMETAFAALVVVVATSSVLFVIKGVPLLAKDPNMAKITFKTGSGFFGLIRYALEPLALLVLIHPGTRKPVSGTSRFRKHAIMKALAVLLVLTYHVLSGARAAMVTFLLAVGSVTVRGSAREAGGQLKIAMLLVLSVLLVGTVGAIRSENAGVPQKLAIEGIHRTKVLQQVVEANDALFELDTSRIVSDFARLFGGNKERGNVALKYQLGGEWAENMEEEAGITPMVIGEGVLVFGLIGAFIWPMLLGVAWGLAYRYHMNANSIFLALFYSSVLIPTTSSWMAGVLTSLPAMAYRTSALFAVFLMGVVLRRNGGGRGHVPIASGYKD